MSSSRTWCHIVKVLTALLKRLTWNVISVLVWDGLVVTWLKGFLAWMFFWGIWWAGEVMLILLVKKSGGDINTQVFIRAIQKWPAIWSFHQGSKLFSHLVYVVILSDLTVNLRCIPWETNPSLWKPYSCFHVKIIERPQGKETKQIHLRGTIVLDINACIFYVSCLCVSSKFSKVMLKIYVTQIWQGMAEYSNTRFVCSFFIKDFMCVWIFLSEKEKFLLQTCLFSTNWSKSKCVSYNASYSQWSGYDSLTSTSAKRMTF